MTEICLVRHGQTDWNFQGIIQGREDIPLNETGRLQARQSADVLRREKWDVMISSPLVRAYETAKEIANAVSIDVIHLEEALVERNFGEASGKPVAEVRHLIADGAALGMETDEELVARCFASMNRIAKKHEGKRIIVVAHSHTIKAVLHAISPREITFATPLHNACINYIVHESHAWEIVKYNVAGHIEI